jgi:Ricin-type beta-trefoil lectin domain
MRSIRSPRPGLRAAAVALVGVAALLAATVAPATVGAAATPVAAAPVVLPTTTVHGESFQLHSALDPSFCAEIDPGATDLRSVTLEPCVAVLAQRWTFSWLATGLNQMIETQGMCVDVSGRKPGDGLAVRVTFCKNARSEKLTFTATGQIEFAKGCLSIPRAAAGAAVFLEACDITNNRQSWKLSQ